MTKKTNLFFVICISLAFLSFAHAQQQRFIAILPFTNTGSAEYNWVSRGIEEILYDKYSNLSSTNVFEKVTLDRILSNNGIQKDADLTVKKAFMVGKETGVDVLIAGSYKVSANKLFLNFRVISTYTGSNILNLNLNGPLAQIYKIHENAIQRSLTVMALPLSSGEEQMLASSSTNSIRAFESYCRAYTEFQKGASMDVVASYFTRALKEDPNFWEAQYNLGVIYYNFDRYEKALSQFRSVISKNPDFYKPYYGLGVIYYLQRQYPRAIQNFDKVLELAPDNDRSLYYLGRIYVQQDSIPKGLEYLDKSAAINPNYAPTQYYIGIANLDRGWYKTAIQALKNSLKLNPENYRAHNALGESFYRLQRFDEAIFEYKKAIELRQDYSTAYFNIGNTVYKRGALEEIVDAYLEILETRYTATSGNSDNSGIAQDLKKLRSEHSSESDAVYSEMIKSYRKALTYEPDFYESAFNLALTYENLGKTDSAEYYYKKAISTNPDLVRAHMRLGRLYEKQQQYDMALRQFKEVVKVEPSYFAATPRLGEEYRYTNIIEDVLKEYQLKLELNPNDPKTLLVLARIFSSLGRYGQAERYYQQLVQLEPQNREASRELKDLKSQRREL